MKTQALGWLTAGVLAAGLNASYHNGGLQWAHRIAERVSYNTNAVLALATGNAGRFYTEARVAHIGEENSPCRLTLAMAQMQHGFPQAGTTLAQFDRRLDREQAQVGRLTARRARMEAKLAHIEIPAVHMQPVTVRVPDVPVCPRIHVNIPRIPEVKMPAIPQVHVELPSAGPV